MADVKLTSDKGSMDKRISDRLKPSGEGLGADHHVVKGTGPTRAHTFIHHGGTAGGSRGVQGNKLTEGEKK